MDGSLGEDGKTPMDYDYNVRVTRQTVDMAHACGVSVEGELGCLGSLETGEAGEEDGIGAAGKLTHDQMLTDPDEAADFVAATGVDALESERFYFYLDLMEQTKIIPLTFILSTLASIYLFSQNFKIINISIFLDFFSILMLNYYLPPLLAFTVYFCFLHSIRHTISLIIHLNQINFKIGFLTFVKKALPLTILTIIICLITLFFLSNYYVLDNAIIKIIFIGLASLTFPHILLEYLLEKNEK